MQHRKITIVIRGKDDPALDDALLEATRLIQEGNISGAESNDEGGFYFKINIDVPIKDRCA